MNIGFNEACKRLEISDAELLRYIEYLDGNGLIFAECVRSFAGHPDIKPWRSDGHWTINPAEMYRLIYGLDDSLIVEGVDGIITYRKSYLPTLEINEKLFSEIGKEIIRQRDKNNNIPFEPQPDKPYSPTWGLLIRALNEYNDWACNRRRKPNKTQIKEWIHKDLMEKKPSRENGTFCREAWVIGLLIAEKFGASDSE
ncbi:hypothetical protein [Methylomagnum sp.]